MTTAARTPLPLTVTVLPATEAYDYNYYRPRLADPSVLGQSVAIRVFRMPFLAVPAGGPRRGGYFSVDHLGIGLAVRGLLEGRPGFTALRLRWSPNRDACHVVEWGDAPPMWGDAARGRFYGYSDTAISKFVDSIARAARRPTTPSLTLSFRSPAGLCVEEGPYPHEQIREEEHHVSARPPLPYR
jgi:hypothetical protein